MTAAVTGGEAGFSLHWWMWPAWQVGRVRPGLRTATVADAHRLAALPAAVGRALLPGIAILVPAFVTVLHAMSQPMIQPVPDSWTLTVTEVFSESLPVMVAMLAVGLAAPSAGVLAMATYAIGDLAATTIRGELEPVHLALLARLVSYWLLFVLAVEIPLMGRTVAEWRIGSEAASVARRWGGVIAGAAVVAATTFIWVQATPLLIGVVFRLTRAWGQPTVAAMYPLQLDGNYLVAGAAVSGLVLLGLRYLGARPFVALDSFDVSTSLPGGPIVRHVVTVVITFIALYGVITQPIDALILLPALVLARPLAQVVLRATGAGPWLGRLPMPIRLVLGFAVAVAVGWVVISILGFQPMSGFFSMVVALALGYVVVTFFIAADEGMAAPAGVAVEPPAAVAQ